MLDQALEGFLHYTDAASRTAALAVLQAAATHHTQWALPITCKLVSVYATTYAPGASTFGLWHLGHAAHVLAVIVLSRVSPAAQEAWNATVR